MLNATDILNQRYRLQRKLGYGGFSEVWYAWDDRDKREVAIKIFLRQDEEGIRLCEREFMRTNRLSHPGVIRFYDFGVFEGAPYLVMPYFHGGTPEAKAGELSEETLWRIIRDIGTALHYLHNLRVPIVHNDLKPDNFLIDRDGHYVLADFGISTELADRLIRSLPADMDGETPRAYRPPELFHYRDAQKKHPVKASDIWAFGACLFELATGDTPFGDQGGIFQLMHQVDQRTPVRELVSGPLPAHYSEQLQSLIYKCLEPETWDRPMAQVLVEAAETYLAGGVTKGIGASAPKQPVNTDSTAQPVWQNISPDPAPLQPEYQRQSLIARKKRRLPAWFWLAGGGALIIAGYLYWQKSQVSSEEQEVMRLQQIAIHLQDSLRQDSILKAQKPILTDEVPVPEKQEPVLTIAQKAQLQVYNDMLNKAIEASGNTAVRRSLLAIQKEPENKEKICKTAESLRKHSITEVRSFANYTVKEVCKTLEKTEGEIVEPPKTIGSTGTNKPLTKDQQDMAAKIGSKKFGILVGTFLLMDNAEKEKNRLLSQFTFSSLIRTIRYDTTGTVKLLDLLDAKDRKKTTYASFLKKKKRNEFSYQVIIPYLTKKDAEKAFSDIKTKLVCDCIVYEYSDSDASVPPKLSNPQKVPVPNAPSTKGQE